MNDFNGKRVVVTGAAGVVGRAVADAFHQANAEVTGIDIVEAKAPYRSIVADLMDPDDASRAVAEVGHIDVLANIAGGFTMGESVAETSDETWDFMFNLNARTVLNMVRAVVPGMRDRGAGRIVNIGARAGLRGAGAMGAYCASKSVVLRLTESLADELKADGINVNCILPSIVDTRPQPGGHAECGLLKVGAAGPDCFGRDVPRIGRRKRDSRRIDPGGRTVLRGLKDAPVP